MDALSLISRLICAALIITIHEFLKCFISYKFGDEAPKKEKRLTLNPLKHIEPIGYLICVFFGLGWGKPLYNQTHFYKNRTRGITLTYVIPPVVNIVLAILLAILYLNINLNLYLYAFFQEFIPMSITFGVLNFIPITPLDGSKILMCFLKPNQIVKYSNMEKTLQIILILLVSFGFISGVNDFILKLILGPLYK